MSRESCLLILGFMALILSGCASYEKRMPVTRWEGSRARVELEYHGEARAVHAAGDFNDWNPESNPFVRTAEEVWICLLDLPEGRYSYLLVVETDSDWSWVLDPLNPDRSKDFLGRELSLLVVSAGQAGEDPAAAHDSSVDNGADERKER